MSMDDLMAVFDNCSFSVYDTFADPGAQLPFCVLIVTDPANTAADNKVYCVNAEARAELYTLGKDYTARAELENALQAAQLPFEHDTSFLDGQRVIMEVYSFGVPLGSVEPVPTPAPDPTPEPEPEPAEDPEE